MPHGSEPPELTRRAFLIAAVTGGATVGLASRAEARRLPRRGTTLVRHSIETEAGVEMLQTYETGVRAMLALPPSDPRSWYRVALVHILDCPHDNWWFLPWHRAYVNHVEQIVRQLTGSPDFAMPFWDWTARPAVHPRLFEGALNISGGAYLSKDDFWPALDRPLAAMWIGMTDLQRSSLRSKHHMLAGYEGFKQMVGGSLERGRGNERALTPASPGFARPGRVSISELRDALAPGEFGVFGSHKPAPGRPTRGLLEGLHNGVHAAIGGMMNTQLSSVDPIFYLHHANVDRLWRIWERKQVGLNRSAAPGEADKGHWEEHRFLFFPRADGEGQRELRVKDVLSAAALGYEYGPGTEPLNLLATIAGVRTAQADILTRNMGFGRAGVARIAIQAPASAAALDALTATVTITRTAETEGTEFLVFLEPPAGENTLTDQDPSFVGTISFFADAEPGTTSFELPLGGVMRRLRLAGRSLPAIKRVEVVPALIGAPRQPIGAVLEGIRVRF